MFKKNFGYMIENCPKKKIFIFFLKKIQIQIKIKIKFNNQFIFNI